ncbi:MAG: hypothetical protein KDC37_08070 [Flavobacteriales bacterium]|nr:hypothetical protein [Flavobacteriales bacterium]
MNYRKIFIGLAMLLMALTTYGQQAVPEWIRLMNAPQPDFFAAHRAYEEYFRGKDKTAFQGHKIFERWRENAQSLLKEDGSLRNPSEMHATAIAYAQTHPARSSAGNWTEVGPDRETNVYRGVGRLTCIAFHPSDKNKLYIGTPSGGIWISEDYGKSWFNPEESLANFGVSSIALNPKNPLEMYLGTGDVDANETQGTGVYKSTDGGYSWIQSNTGMGNLAVGKLMIHPDSVSMVFAATKQGIYKSRDAGQTWRLVSVTNDMRDMEFHPTNRNIIYASNYSAPSTSSFIYVSKDKGETWTRMFITEGLYPDIRYELAVTAQHPDRLYAMGGQRMQMSENAGDSFYIKISSGNQLIAYDRQGWYNASFTVHPRNSDVMFSGNQALYKSVDGGNTWFRLNHTHADNHWIEYNPLDNALYVLDDGGIHRSFDDGRSFEDLTGLGMAAIYSVAQSPFNAHHVLNGYQDCGCKYYDGYQWRSVYGADGMVCLFDPTDSMKFYTAYQYGNIIRYLKGIGTAQGIKMPSDEGGWVGPYILDWNNSSVMYTARERIWKSTNIHTKKAGDVTWTDISSGPALNTGGTYNKLKQHRANPKAMYALRRNSTRTQTVLIHCPDIYASTPVWNSFGGTYPNTANSPDFETHPSDSNILWLIAGGNILKTMDGGQSWSNMNGSLPSVGYHCIEVDSVTKDLYLGTDIGVFYRADTASDWVAFNQGMSRNARVRDIDIYYHPTQHSKSRIKAATYGRGLWESDLYNSGQLTEDAAHCYIQRKGKAYTYSPTFEVSIDFKRHLRKEAVTGFDTTDIIVRNGKVLSLTGGPSYTAKIEAASTGTIYIDVPAGAATDNRLGQPTDSARTIWVNYVAAPIQIGPYGPGGIGDSAHLVLWLRSDSLLLNPSDVKPTLDGEKVRYWRNMAPHSFYAIQNTDSSRPAYRVDTAGINGYPAVEFVPPNRFVMVNGLHPVGENLSVFTVAKSNTENWEGHSWLANSRENNGFLLHNNDDSKNFYAIPADNAKRYLGTSTIETWSVQQPHIYALQHTPAMLRTTAQIDQQITYDNRTIQYYRRGDDTINVRIGKDIDERYGNGKMAEFIYYNEDIFETRRLILSNYLAARYNIPLYEDTRYSFADGYSHHVAGIGRVDALDFHDAARGTGLLHIDQPSGMNDGQFLMWGSDNSSHRAWYTGLLPDDMSRIMRTWRFSQTGGSMRGVRVRIEQHLLPSTSEQVALLFAADSGFTSNLRIVSLALTDSHYTAVIDPLHGEFMTVVAAEKYYLQNQPSTAQMGSRIYPNPSGLDHTNIEVFAPGAGFVNVALRDIHGRSVSKTVFEVVSGLNQFAVSLGDLPVGLFFLEIQSTWGEAVHKVIRFGGQ